MMKTHSTAPPPGANNNRPDNTTPSPGHVESPPTPENRGFCAWIASFINYLAGKFGERMSPSQLNAALNSLFSDWNHGPSFENGGINQTAWRSTQTGGVTYVVSATAHDLADENSIQAQFAGGRSASQVLAEINTHFSDGQVKVLLPVAQSNKLGSGIRGHFVLLEVNINNGQIQSAQIHDSKGGLIDIFYHGARHLTQQLRGNAALGLDGNFSVGVEHRGDQSLFNDSDCGRYAAWYAASIAQNGDLSNVSNKGARAFFNEKLRS